MKTNMARVARANQSFLDLLMYERCGIHAPREVTKLEELVPRVLRIGGMEGDRSEQL